jgi:hypothetical protein
MMTGLELRKRGVCKTWPEDGDEVWLLETKCCTAELGLDWGATRTELLAGWECGNTNTLVLVCGEIII